MSEAASGSWWRHTRRYLLAFLPHVLLAPVGLVLHTLRHELAHAAMALMLGGSVRQLSFLPDASHAGFVLTEPGPTMTPEQAAWFADLVSLAPYFLDVGLIAAIGLLALTDRDLSWPVATTVFLWGYALSLVDLGLNAVNPTGDLGFTAPWRLPFLLGCSAFLLGAWALGHPIQRRLFGERSVDLVGYIMATVVVCGGVGAMGLLTLAWFRG